MSIKFTWYRHEKVKYLKHSWLVTYSNSLAAITFMSFFLSFLIKCIH